MTDLYRESVFIVVSVAVHIVADQLLAVLILDRDHRLEELHQRLPFALRGEEEVQPLVMGLDAHTVLGGVILDQKLFQEEKGLPLFRLLSDLWMR